MTAMYQKSDGTLVSVRSMATTHLEHALAKATHSGVRETLQHELSLRAEPRWFVRVLPPLAKPVDFNATAPVTCADAWKLLKLIKEKPDTLIPPLPLFPAGSIFSVELADDRTVEPIAEEAQNFQPGPMEAGQPLDGPAGV